MAIQERGTIEDLESIMSAAEKQLTSRPSSVIFVLVALAYQKLGDKEKMCQTITSGLSIYSHNSDLVTAREYCQ
jgi:hypothetical protein